MCVGMDAMKTVDTDNSSESTFTTDVFEKLINTYVSENKDKVDGIVAMAIDMVNDFEKSGGIL